MFTHEFDATTSIYIAYAILEKADCEESHANELKSQAEASRPGLREMLELQSLQAHNRAKLLRDAGNDIRLKIQKSLSADLGRALDQAGE